MLCCAVLCRAVLRFVVHAHELIGRSTGLVISGSWDKSVSLWDPRQRTAVGNFAHPDKVLALSAVDDTIVVGTGGRHVWIWDLRHMEVCCSAPLAFWFLLACLQCTACLLVLLACSPAPSEPPPNQCMPPAVMNPVLARPPAPTKHARLMAPVAAVV